MKNRNDNSCTANTLDWNPLADLIDTDDIADVASPFLETEQYTSHTEYDALNRPISLTTPDGSVNLPTYNEAGLLDKVQARLRGASVDDATPFVTNINYDAKGQRELVEYANGVYTEYTYDPLTFRVIRIHTIRTKDNACLQDLNYTYDPVGNITELRDNAQKTIFYDNARVEPVNSYEYDALYRLIHAEGREHAGQNADAQASHHNPPIINTPHPNDAQAMRNYTEDYVYDEVGNILCMDHKFANGGWKRNYEYEEVSNRLEFTSLPGDDPEGPYSARYNYDAHGNMIEMPHLQEMCWDFKDQMCQVDLNGGGTAYYVYDAGGQRTRKVHEHNGSTLEERIYLGGYEIYRKHNGTGLTLERETLHIMDDQQRIALVETKTREEGLEVPEPEALVRYQLNNHLGSSSLELDGDGVEISYEEYYPYGNTSYQAVDQEIKAAAKRYRYTGKERDDETGLYYYGARYYAAWLGRWVSCDPMGFVDGINLYRYSQNNPVKLGDASGTKSNEPNINNTDINEQYWQDNPNLICSENNQSCYYTDPKTGGTWIGKEGQWIDYSPAGTITITSSYIEQENASNIYEQGPYTAYYQLRKEAGNYDWYDPRNIALNIGAQFSFIGGSLIDLSHTPGKLINAADPTGAGQITLMQLSQSTPVPFDDIVASSIRFLGRSARSWAPSYVKMNVACSLAQSDINVIAKASNLGFELGPKVFSGISPELGTLRLGYTSGSEMFYALKGLRSSGARWGGLHPEPFNTAGFIGRFQVDPAFLPKGPLAIFQLKLKPGIPYLESYVNPSPIGLNIPGFEQYTHQFLFRSPVSIRKVMGAGFKKR